MFGQICTRSAPPGCYSRCPETMMLKTMRNYRAVTPLSQQRTAQGWSIDDSNRNTKGYPVPVTNSKSPWQLLVGNFTAWPIFRGCVSFRKGTVIVRRFLVDNHHTVTTYNKPKCQPGFHKGSWEISPDLRKIPTSMPLRNQSCSISTLS